MWRGGEKKDFWSPQCWSRCKAPPGRSRQREETESTSGLPSFRQTQRFTSSRQHHYAPPRARAGTNQNQGAFPPSSLAGGLRARSRRRLATRKWLFWRRRAWGGGACDAPACYSGASFACGFGFVFCWESAAGFAGTAVMSSVLSYESLVHAVAGAVVRRGLHARATAGCGGLSGARPGFGWGMGMTRRSCRDWGVEEWGKS